MADPDFAERAGENGDGRVRFGTEPEEGTPAVTWRTIRFVELFLAVSCMSSLMALYMMNPIYDDYTRLCEDLVRSLRSPGTRGNNHPSLGTGQSGHEYDPPSMPGHGWDEEETLGGPTTKSDAPDLGRASFRLSYAIILFTLTTTVLVILVLDLIIFMLAVSEILCLVIMVLSLDMFLGAINGTILAVSALALGLSICFVTDIVYTSVRGNG